MGIAGSLLFIALGAILAFAIEIESAGVLNINTIGWILMLVGLIGLGLQFITWRPRRATVVADGPTDGPTGAAGRGPHLRDARDVGPVEDDGRGPHLRDAGPTP
ncbi:hypothetical protein [Nocardiopsis ansamitocini]|uniref:Uncharacterized protein n=1 Tax=Nocardiopsis ansamitocini TaxID=1670832 RepID=A0A9W6P263_9ACTN|nr:hypothetical protein [Nocardiopsis ansamitocini]GLU45759.1 hypothetical protein Nans01_01100 [Nocardiopsis ansamitocini]